MRTVGNGAAEPTPGRRILFAAIVAASICAGQELLARWLFPLPEVADFGLSNVRIRWESEPNGFAFDHTLNLYGFRGPDFRVEPPADRRRVLFVGDSYVEGCGASDDATLPAQFAAVLPSAERVGAINLGVAAANFAEYTRLARDGVSLLRPFRRRERRVRHRPEPPRWAAASRDARRRRAPPPAGAPPRGHARARPAVHRHDRCVHRGRAGRSARSGRSTATAARAATASSGRSAPATGRRAARRDEARRGDSPIG